MRFIPLFLIALVIGAECYKGYKSLGSSKKTAKKSVKKVGELTIKGGLSVLSMSAALAFLDAMEKALSPDDTEGLERIMAERRALLESMSNSTSPWTYGGVGVCLLLIFGGLLTWCRTKKQKEIESSSMVILGSPQKEDMDEDGEKAGGVRFGEVDPSML